MIRDYFCQPACDSSTLNNSMVILDLVVINANTIFSITSATTSLLNEILVHIWQLPL